MESDHLVSRENRGGAVSVAEVPVVELDCVDERGSGLAVFIAVYFVTVATVLGSGILGLPVELVDSGFSPFMLPLSACCVIQIFIVILMTEILQSAQALQETQEGSDNNQLILNSHEEASASYHNLSDPSVYKPPPAEKATLTRGPDLHMIAGFYLNKVNLVIFEFMVIVNFVSIMVGYSLAGSEAWGSVLHIDYRYIIPIFVVVYTLIIVVFNRWLPPILSFLTFGNAALLLLMIGVTAYIGSMTETRGTSNWDFVGQPFLLSTVALGGIPNTLPVVFSRIQQVPRDIRKFKIAVAIGLLTCLALNALWCYFVLQVVPQHGPSPSLQYARSHGQISTVPLTDIINNSFPKYKWISVIVQGFILLAVTVSFLTMGAGFAHLLDGYAKQLVQTNFAKRAYSLRDYKLSARLLSSALSWQIGMYTIGFGMIAVVAFSNPQGFLVVLSKVTSMAVNLESGMYIGVMFIAARARRRKEGTAIASELGPGFMSVAYFIIGYFIFAVLYDLLSIFIKLVAPNAAINDYI